MKIIKSGLTKAEVQAFIDPKSHFFDRGTMRFFASKFETGYRVDVDNAESHALVFITSEKKCFDDLRRCYTVRIIRTYHGGVRTFGEHGAHATLTDAREAAKSAVDDGTILSAT